MSDELRPGHTYEFICIQVDIANHSQIDAPSRVLLEVKRRLRSILDSTLKVYADAAPYVRMHWNGDGGAFLIQTHDGKPFEKSIWAAFKIRDDMKSLNREFQSVHELTEPIVLRISMDCGNALYSDDPGTIHSEMLNKLFKYERDIGTPNQVAITDRIYREIKPSLRKMFVERNQSDKLAAQIYVSVDDNQPVVDNLRPTFKNEPGPADSTPPPRSESDNLTFKVELPSAIQDKPIQINIAVDRRELIKTLQSLTESDFRDFVQQFYGRRHVPAMHHGLKEKVTELVDWAETIKGPGLHQLALDLQAFLDFEIPNLIRGKGTSGETALLSKASSPVSENQRMVFKPATERMHLGDDLEILPTSYLKAFISRYYGPKYKPFDGENHEIVQKFLGWALEVSDYSISSIRTNLAEYKASKGGGHSGSPTMPANPSPAKPSADAQGAIQKHDDDLSDWTESDWVRLKDAISRLSLSRESSRTEFLRPIIADQVRNNPWSEFIQNPSVREFENSFVDEIMHKKSRVLLKRLLEATLRRSLSETDKTWLNAKLATI